MDTLELAAGRRIANLRLMSSHTPKRMPFDTDSTPVIVTWNCTCKCGAETVTTESKLLSGEVTACYNCMKKGRKQYQYNTTREAIVNGIPISEIENYQPKPGDLLSELTLLEPADSERWHVQCSCGRKAVFRTKTLLSKRGAVRKCVECSSCSTD